MNRNKGFSLIELICAMAILLIVAGTALYGLAVYQQQYAGTSVRQNMQSSVRNATEMLQQEIGQAGAFTGVGGVSQVTISAASKGSSTVTVTPAGITASMFVGENLQVNDTNQETVAITAIGVNTITATFANAHAASTIVTLGGIFPQGILWGQISSATQSGPNDLYLIGDVNSDGNLYYVHYNCNQSSTPPNYGTFSRSILKLPSGTVSTDTLVQNVIPNPDGSACFTYTGRTTVGTFINIVPNVGLTLTTASSQKDPSLAGCGGVSTGSTTTCYITVTNSFLNLSPRNVLYGKALASAGTNNTLQPLPLITYFSSFP